MALFLLSAGRENEFGIYCVPSEDRLIGRRDNTRRRGAERAAVQYYPRVVLLNLGSAVLRIKDMLDAADRGQVVLQEFCKPQLQHMHRHLQTTDAVPPTHLHVVLLRPVQAHVKSISHLDPRRAEALRTTGARLRVKLARGPLQAMQATRRLNLFGAFFEGSLSSRPLGYPQLCFGQAMILRMDEGKRLDWVRLQLRTKHANRPTCTLTLPNCVLDRQMGFVDEEEDSIDRAGSDRDDGWEDRANSPRGGWNTNTDANSYTNSPERGDDDAYYE